MNFVDIYQLECISSWQWWYREYIPLHTMIFRFTRNTSKHLIQNFTILWTEKLCSWYKSTNYSWRISTSILAPLCCIWRGLSYTAERCQVQVDHRDLGHRALNRWIAALSRSLMRDSIDFWGYPGISLRTRLYLDGRFSSWIEPWEAWMGNP